MATTGGRLMTNLNVDDDGTVDVSNVIIDYIRERKLADDLAAVLDSYQNHAWPERARVLARYREARQR